MRFIYGLCDPRSGELRYVGVTNDLRDRFSRHVANRRDRTWCANWIASLHTQGVKPEMFEIERVPLDEWREAERFWIMYYRGLGCRLTNIADGGIGYSSYSPEYRERHRAALNRPEVKARMRAARLGKRPSPEARAAHLAAMRTPEFRAKISAIQRGKRATLETRAKMAAAWTPEQRQRMSALKRAVPPRPDAGLLIKLGQAKVSPEAEAARRAKISAFYKGKHLTTKHRAWLSERAKARGISPEQRARLVARLHETGAFQRMWETRRANAALRRNTDRLAGPQEVRSAAPCGE